MHAPRLRIRRKNKRKKKKNVEEDINILPDNGNMIEVLYCSVFSQNRVIVCKVVFFSLELVDTTSADVLLPVRKFRKYTLRTINISLFQPSGTC